MAFPYFRVIKIFYTICMRLYMVQYSKILKSRFISYRDMLILEVSARNVFLKIAIALICPTYTMNFY